MAMESGLLGFVIGEKYPFLGRLPKPLGRILFSERETVLWEDGMVKSPERWQRAVEKTVRSFSSHVVWGK